MTSPPSASARAEEKQPQMRESILIVDDDAFVLQALEQILIRQGHDVILAATGHDALKIIKQMPVAVIICDLLLPGISGSAFLGEAEKIDPEAVRIALTGSRDLNLALEAINVGHISHFIMKPWDLTSLNQIVISSLEKYRLVKKNKELEQMIFAQHAELEKTHQALRYELQLVVRIHEELLLGKIPTGLEAIDMAALAAPSEDIDGDFFDFYRPNPACLDIVVGDAMGKGMPAALVGIALKKELQRFALPFVHSVFCDKGQPWQEDLLSPEKIVTYADEAIASHLMNLDFFATIVYGRFDFATQMFTFVNCGSPKPIHYNAATQQTSLLLTGNAPIGATTGQIFQQSTLQWQPNDLLVFYSDGITECRSPSQEHFGVERLQKIVEANASMDAKALVEIIKSELVRFSERQFFEDDVTLVVAKMKTPLPEKKNDYLQKTFRSDFDELSALRNFVDVFCQKAPGDRLSLTRDLQLAMNEAFCNILKHSYKEKKDREVVVRVEKLEEGILIDLCDRGEAFDPVHVSLPDFSGVKERGFGLYMMNAISDKLVYLRKTKTEGWNRLRIFKSYGVILK